MTPFTLVNTTQGFSTKAVSSTHTVLVVVNNSKLNTLQLYWDDPTGCGV